MTPEDEAFDEIARKQGHWGGGFMAKRAMAADKLQEPWNEDEWRRNNWRCSHGWLRGEQCEICNAAQPAQEPVTTVTSETGNPNVTMSWWHEPPLPVGTPLYTYPPKRPWVGLTEEDFSAINQSCFTKLQAATSAESILKERNI